MGRSRARSALVGVIGAAGVAVLAAGCSSGSGSPGTSTARQQTSTASGASLAAATAAKKVIAPYIQIPASIGITTPLKTRPPKNKTLFWLEGNLESYQSATEGYQGAAKALGWNLRILTYDPSSATAANSVMQQAVNQHADYIAISGLPSTVYAQALKSANAAHIPVVDQATANYAGGPVNGIYFVMDTPAFNVQAGKLLANWIIADSNGTGKAVFFDVPDYSSLLTQTQAAIQAMKACTTCSSAVDNVSVQALAQGAVPAAAVSYVQSHPDTEYVVMAIGQMTTGVRQALDAAGVGQNVKIVTQLPQASNMQAVADVQEQTVLTGPNAEASWQAVDALTRLSENMSLAPDKASMLPVWFITKSTLPSPLVVPGGVPGYEQQFEKLWHVSS